MVTHLFFMQLFRGICFGVVIVISLTWKTERFSFCLFSAQKLIFSFNDVIFLLFLGIQNPDSSSLWLKSNPVLVNKGDVIQDFFSAFFLYS